MIEDLVADIRSAQEPKARPNYRLFEDYYAGRHQLKFATAKFSRDYSQLVVGLRENLCPAAVSGFVDDLNLRTWGPGLDVGAEATLSRTLSSLLLGAWKAGDAYVLVWPNRAGKSIPRIQSAEVGIPTVDPDDPTQLLRWTKHWIDPRTGYGRAMVVYPDRVERWVTVDKLRSEHSAHPQPFPEDSTGYVPYTGDGDDSVIPHLYGKVPVCWLPLDSDGSGGYGRSILTDVVPLQDALNKEWANILVAAEAAAEPLWYLLRYRSEDRPQPANPFVPTPNTDALNLGGLDLTGPTNPAPAPRQQQFDRRNQRILVSSAEGPAGTFDPPNLGPMLEVKDAIALGIARTIGLPSFYFTQTSGDVPSGESLRVLSSRRRGRLRRFQQASLPVLRGLAELMGVQNPEPEWEPIAQLDEAERWQVAQTQHEMGLATEDVLSMAGVADAVEMAARAGTTAAQLGRALAGNIGLG